MMIAPTARDGEVKLVPPSALISPAIVLHRPLQDVERVWGADGLVLMNHRHLPELLDAAAQSEADWSQPDTTFCGVKSRAATRRVRLDEPTGFSRRANCTV